MSGPVSGEDEMLARYRAAEAVLEPNVARLVRNESVVPHWVGESSFWYRRESETGDAYRWIEADGKARATFDPASLEALRAATGGASPPQVERIGADGTIVALHGGRRYTKAPGAPVRDEAADAPPRELLVSPDGARALLARDDDLYLRELASGDERRLTDSGEADFAWGQYPDAGLLGVVRRRSGLPFAPYGWSWSPDGKWLVGGRVDVRHIEPYPFVESVPQDGGFRPRVYPVRQPLAGEPGPRFEAVAIEAASGRTVTIELPDDLARANAVIEPLAWRPDRPALFAIVNAAAGRELRLVEIELAAGAVRTIVTERTQAYVTLNSELYNLPNVRLIRNGNEAIWFSQRSGWGHLYRYDCASGALLNPITSGEWLVRDIIDVDEARGRLFFTAAGREGGNPYYRRLYRVDLDGSNLTLLTPEEADHGFDGAPIPILARLYNVPSPPPRISPDGSVFVDTRSTVSEPPISTLRSTEDGRIIALLETADASALLATGWAAPEPFVAKAADGTTDLYGVLYRAAPGGERPAPMIDGIYGGPQVTIVPRSFRAARGALGGYGRSALARLGFNVMVVDGRGTPLRSKAFHDAGFGNFADLAIEDHAAVIEQLCARDPTLDRDRIGIYGHSFGGYTSARALLTHPDLYKVGVSSAGSHNLHGIYPLGSYLPVPTYGDGVTEKPGHDAIPDNFAALDTATLAANLRGKLLLACGDMDENAFPALTLQLYDALIRANRSPDLLYLANRTHGFASEPYYVRRLWDYFVEHLLGRTPPPDYEIRGAPAGGTIG